MLNKSSVEVSANIAEVLVDRNIKLTTKPSTLVAELTSVIRNACFQDKFLDRESVISTIVNTSLGEDVGGRDGQTTYVNSEHDAIMDNYIGDMSVLVGNYLSFSRSVVNAKVTEFKEKLSLDVNNYRYRNPEDFFDVSYYTLPTIFKSPLVKDAVETSTGKTNKQSLDHVNLQVLVTEDDLTEYFMTGHEDSDLDIRSWLKTVPSVKGLLLDPVDELKLSVQDSLEYALINYIFYRNLAERTNINTGDSTVALRNKCINNRKYFSSLLASSLNLFSMIMKSGKLLGVDTNTNFSYLYEGPFKVTVFEDNFTKAAEEGCSIETIFGYLSSTDSSLDLTFKNLVTNKDKYNSTWARTRSLYVVHLNNSRLDIFRHLTRVVVDESLQKDNVTESELEMLNSDGGFLQTSLKLSHDYIDNLTTGDIEDIDRVCLELVAKIRFRFTNAYTILNNMDKLLKADANLDPKEAALYSAIDYLVEYCLQQVDTIKL